MTEFEIGGHIYRMGKMDARTQFHVARRLVPLLTKVQGIRTEDILAPGANLTLAMMPVAEALSELPDAECDYVLNACLSLCSRKQGSNAWAPIWNVQAKRLQFDDLAMFDMLKIAGQVIMGSFGDFFTGPGQSSIGEATPATPSSL